MRTPLILLLAGLALATAACGPLQPATDPPRYGEIGGRSGGA